MRIEVAVLFGLALVGCVRSPSGRVGSDGSSSSGTAGATASGSGSTTSSSSSSGNGTTGSTGSTGSTGTAGSTGTTGSTGSSGCAGLLSDFCQLAQQCGFFDSNCAQVLAPTGSFGCDTTAAIPCDTSIISALNSNDCRLFFERGTPTAAACTTAFAGALYFDQSVPEGSACRASANCASRSDGGQVWCSSQEICPGVCSAGMIGEHCLDTNCNEGYCANGTCTAFDGAGASCQLGEGNCDPGTTFCDVAAGSTTGSCQSYLPEGTPCAGPECDPARDFCGTAVDGGWVCLPRLAPGTACNWVHSVNCEAGSICFLASDAGLVCQAPVPVGQPCVIYEGTNNCAPGDICLNGSCQPEPASPGIGDPCYPSGPTCTVGFCDVDAGVCAASADYGQPCHTTPCRIGLLCRPDGTCGGPPAAGEPCTADLVGPCRRGDFCDLQGTCRLMASLGQACDNTPYMPTCIDATCDGTGHCVALSAPGAPCELGKFQCSDQVNGGCALDTASNGVTWACSDYVVCGFPGDGGTSRSCASACP